MLRYWGALLLPTILVAAAPIPIAKPSVEHGRHDNAHAPNEPANSKQSADATMARVGIYEQTYNVGREPGKQEEQPGWFGIPFDGWVAGATIALAFATFGLFIFTWRLWKSTSTLVKDERIDTARELRAYVMTGKFKMERWEEHGRFRVLAEIINSGKTPAYRIQQKWGFRVGEETVDDPLTEEERLRGKVPLGPGLDHIATVWCPLSKVPTGHEKPKVRFFLVGLIEYEDAFHESHKTKFRAMIVRNPEGGYAMRSTEEGNDAD